ncbi:MAG: hypothetical protein HYT98_02540 [Candidatus Sungbacteria bacterium]|nr:hypothetical protein [Candidatus Sungbacteria bacterium]
MEGSLPLHTCGCGASARRASRMIHKSDGCPGGKGRASGKAIRYALSRRTARQETFAKKKLAKDQSR